MRYNKTITRKIIRNTFSNNNYRKLHNGLGSTTKEGHTRLFCPDCKEWGDKVILFFIKRKCKKCNGSGYVNN